MRFLALLGVVVGLGHGGAQAQTAAELLQTLDAQMGETGQLRDLLSHPDPERSRGAMKLMAESGNPDLMRMAIDAGLSSADPVAQRIALEGYLQSKPVLQVSVDGSSLEDTKNLKSDMGQVNGTVSSSQIGYFTVKVGDFDDKKSCWRWADGKACLIRLTDAGASILLFKKWAALRVGENRALRGEHSLHYTGVPLPISIPVAP